MVKQSEILSAETWHFPPETATFLEALKANNNRDWFAENKSAYEQAVKLPAQQFCTLMADALADLTGDIHDFKIFRVHRDVRFSKDKTPYNAHLHISFLPAGREGVSPAWFFGLEPGKLALGAGVFGFDKQLLEKFREQVAGSGGRELAGILNQMNNSGIRISKPELKRVPPGFDKDHQFAENLRRKSLAVWIDLENADMVSEPNLVPSCTTSFGRLKPVVDWLQSL